MATTKAPAIAVIDLGSTSIQAGGINAPAAPAARSRARTS